MLVLTRKTQQQIQIGNNIVITILHVKGQAVRVGIEAPRIREGALAEVVLIDPEASLMVERLPFQSKSRNTPFMKHELKGKIMLTLARGQIAFEALGGAQ